MPPLLQSDMLKAVLQDTLELESALWTLYMSHEAVGLHSKNMEFLHIVRIKLTHTHG